MSEEEVKAAQSLRSQIKRDVKPGTITRLDEERARDTDRNLTLRLNDEYQVLLREGCLLFNTDQEATVIKILWEAGWNAIHATFSNKTIDWIQSPTRLRKRDRTRRKDQNAIQKTPEM